MTRAARGALGGFHLRVLPVLALALSLLALAPAPAAAEAVCAAGACAQEMRFERGSGTCDEPAPFYWTSRGANVTASAAGSHRAQVGASCYSYDGEAEGVRRAGWYSAVWVNYDSHGTPAGYRYGQVAWQAYDLDGNRACSTELSSSGLSHVDAGCPAGPPPRAAALLP